MLDGRAEAYAGQRGSLPAGLCSPVEALGESLVGQLRATAGVRRSVRSAKFEEVSIDRETPRRRCTQITFFYCSTLRREWSTE